MLDLAVTGAAGTIGSVLCRRLLQDGHSVRFFNRPSDRAKRVATRLEGVVPVWGDVTELSDVKTAIKGVDGIFHLADIIPPGSEKNPELAEKISVGGTKNVLRAIKEEERDVKLVYPSSISIFGSTADEKPPIRVDHPITATDHYTSHKIECERLIKRSGVRYVILRLSGVMSPTIVIGEDISLMYQIPADQRVEYVHVEDVATACINAMLSKEGEGKIFIIAGGEPWRMTFYEQIRMILSDGFGLPPPPREKFTTKPYYTDWYDTAESQRILKYQSRTPEDYLDDLKKAVGFKRYLSKLFGRFFVKY